MRLPPELLLSAYSQGWFPMAHEDGELYWHEPDPRTILPLDSFHVSRSLQRTLKKGAYAVRRNTAFTAVIHACAAPTPGREDTWINSDIIAAYTLLHRLGYAHSVETWRNGRLVGGLYGVAVQGLFAGESMFSYETDASKVALVHLVQHLRAQGYRLLDVQYTTPHLQRFGAIEISAAAYRQRLAEALRVTAVF
ncbi:MAG: leucyl/phenylalanyl-tRNA--protein transferase [Chloroflexi bacterium]|nr:leucyl/phenylalanyl-tRNA--protein transferase [Chloroflexota bacterium]